MPGFDRTGPMGMGPRSGWGMGLCNPSGPYYGPGFGRGWGRGWGWRRWAMGWGPGPWWSADPAAIAEGLRAEAEWLRRRLEVVEAELARIEQEGSAEEEE